MSEHQEQVAVIQWFDLQYVDLKGRLFAVPNGARTSMGTAVKLKREGLRKGVPDLFLIYRTTKYTGLAIEMKDTKGKVSIEQTDWLAYLASQGFRTAVCFGCDDARAVITDYLLEMHKTLFL